MNFDHHLKTEPKLYTHGGQAMTTTKRIDGDTATPTTDHRFVLDASDAGLRAGEWPDAVSVRLDGTDCVLQRAEDDRRGGEDLWGVFYRSAQSPVHLLVVND